jgi:hypothetical protein
MYDWGLNVLLLRLYSVHCKVFHLLARGRQQRISREEKQRSRAVVSFAQSQCSVTRLGLAIKPEEERQEIHG